MVFRSFGIFFFFILITSCSLIKPILAGKQYSLQDVTNAAAAGNEELAYKEASLVDVSGLTGDALAQYSFLRAFLSYRTGHYAHAREYFNPLLKEKSGVPDYIQWYLAQSYEKSGDCKAAIPHLETIAGSYTESVFYKPAVQLLGQCMTALKDYSGAIKLYSRYITEPSFYRELPELLSLRAGLSVSTQDTAGAVKDYVRLYTMFPGSPYAGDAFSALGTITDVTSLNIDHYQVARLCMMDGKYQSALRELGTALSAITPSVSRNELSRIYKDMGIAYYHTGSYSAAITSLQASLKYSNLDGDDYPETLFWLGKAYEEKKQTDDAMNTFLQLAVLRSSFRPMAMYKLSVLYGQQDHEGTARRWLMKLANTDTPFSLAAYWSLAWSYYKTGDFRNALHFLNKMEHSKYSDNLAAIKAAYWKARILLKQGNTDRANKMFFAIAQSMPLNYYTVMANTWIGVNRISYDPADVYAPHAVSPDPFFQYHYSRYLYLEGLGMRHDALRELAALSSLNLSENEYLVLCYAYYMNGDYFHSLYIARTQLGDMLQTFDPGTIPVWFYSYPSGYAQIIREYAKKYALNPFILYSLILQESRFKPDAVSNAGALGIMQIMPLTASRVAKQISLTTFSPDLLLDPQINLGIGTWYFKKLMTKYNNNYVLSLAAYNAGEKAVDMWLAHSDDCTTDEFVEDIPFGETRHYVKSIVTNLAAYTMIYGGSINLEKQIDLGSSFLKGCLPQQ